MTTALVTTDPCIGPWVIPSRGQNLIIHAYASAKNIKIDTVIPEPLFSRELSTTRWVLKNKGLSRILLCSYHQLNPEKRSQLIEELEPLEIHFVLEELTGKGTDFLTKVFNEIEIFQNTNSIPIEKLTSYQEMQNTLQMAGDRP